MVVVICQGPLAGASLCKYRDFDQPRVARASLAVAWQSQVDEMFFCQQVRWRGSIKVDISWDFI